MSSVRYAWARRFEINKTTLIATPHRISRKITARNIMNKFDPSASQNAFRQICSFQIEVINVIRKRKNVIKTMPR